MLGARGPVGEDGGVQTPYVPPARAREEPEPRLRRPGARAASWGASAPGWPTTCRSRSGTCGWRSSLATFLGGAGIVAYLFLWALTPQTLDVPSPRTAPERRAGGVPADPRAARRVPAETLRSIAVGAGLVVLGAALFAQQAGLNLRLGVLVPLLAVAVGAVLAWSQLDGAERDRWLARGGDSRREGLVRLGFGIALATVGVVVLATQGRALAGRLGRGRRRGRRARRRRAHRGAVGRPALDTTCAHEQAERSARPSAPTSPPTCTTRSCRPSP